MNWFEKKEAVAYPPGVVTTLEDLMRFEFLVQSKNLLPKKNVYSILAGGHSSKLRGRGLDFEEVRQYVAGDDIRNIDWRVTARTGETHSKVFNEEKERPTFVLLDQTSWMFFGSTRFVKSVSAAHAAALSAFYTLKRGDRTGGIVFNESGYDYVAPKRSKALVQYFLECVVNRNKVLPERKTVQPNTAGLNEMLQRTRATVTHDYVITVISDFSAINEETKHYLKSLSAHNDVMLIHIYDEMDDHQPDGKLVLGDGRRQIRWNNNRKRWGQAYREDFLKLRTRLTDEFRLYRIPVIFFNTTEKIEDQVIHDMNKFLQHG
ncbi:MAG TPA: DUF58 domain-containing protein [Puia sp.]|nr:DUF58 domain-containing protein [Puia sp.]